MTGSALGKRIKRYEAAGRHQFPTRQPLMIRVDGRAFHTYTRGLNRPFDTGLMGAMVHATKQTAKDMAGFKLAYTQSDEATFLLTDFDKLNTQGWFDYDLNKVVSLSASLFTAHFNRCMHGHPPATFDSRAFVIPIDDAPNAFVWRQQDWARNSLSMLAQAHFSHNQLHNKHAGEIHQMLHTKGINWANLSAREKNGTFILRNGLLVEQRADYDQILNWITAEVSA